jgi:hypothetical protein
MEAKKAAAQCEWNAPTTDYMIAQLREDLHTPQLIALLAVNTKFEEGTNIYTDHCKAQQEVAARAPRSAYVDTSTATLW